MHYTSVLFSTVLIGIFSGVIVLYYPKLGLPDSQTFQLLDSNHLFELYDSKYRYMYRFERSFTVRKTDFYVYFELFFEFISATEFHSYR